MDVDMDMDTSPSNMNPKDFTVRELFRRYGYYVYKKRHSATFILPLRERSASKFSESMLLYDGQSIHSPTNAALFLENIKQEAESIVDHSEGTPARTQSASKWRLSIDGQGMPDMDTGLMPIPDLILRFRDLAEMF